MIHRINWRSPTVVNAVIALWLVAAANLTFFRRLAALSPLDGWQATLFLFSATVLLWAYINFFLQLVTWGRLARPTLSFILVASAVTAFFVDTYGVGIDAGQLQNALETDRREVFDLLSWQLAAYLAVIAGLPLLWLWWRPQARTALWPRQRARLLSCLLSLCLAGVVAAIYFADYASTFRNHREVRLLINPHNYIAALSSHLRHASPAGDLPLIPYGDDASRLQTTTAGKPVLMVLVVGETARAESFGLNGYDRDTTPELARSQVLNFTRTSSCGTATAVSLPCMFSGFTRADYDARVASHREGLLDILQRAGYEVTWIDNNSGCKGACARVGQTPLLASRRAAWCDAEGECHDDILADTLDDLLRHAPVRDRVIVLHQAGSHGPAYYKRYPAAFRRFTPTCESNQLQSCPRQAVINTYDNTIAYTDHVLARVIDLLQAQDGRYRAAFWYVSDHGESTGEHGLYLHGAPYLFAPSQQTHVPMVAWFSPDFAADTRTDCIRARQHAEVSHDNLFHTVLGLLHVHTGVYRQDLDISAACQA